MRNGLIELTARVGPEGLRIERITRRLPDGTGVHWPTDSQNQGYRWRRLDGAGDPPLAGYTVIERPDGGATLVAAAAGTSGVFGSQRIDLDRRSATVKVAQHRWSIERQPVGEHWAWTVAVGDAGRGLEPPVWPAGPGGRPRSPLPWFALPRASGPACLTHWIHGAQGGTLRRLAAERDGGPIAAVPAAEPLAAGSAREMTMTLTAHTGLAAPRLVGGTVMLTAERVAEGWVVAVAAGRRIAQAELLATAGSRRFKQTVNVRPGRPLVSTIPLDADPLKIALTQADGRTLLSGDLPQPMGVRLETIKAMEAPKARASKPRPKARGSESHAAAIDRVLALIRAGELIEARTRLAALKPHGDEAGAGAATVGMVGLIELALAERDNSAEGDDSTTEDAPQSAAARLLSRDPGLVEAWHVAGDRQQVERLTRWSPDRAAQAERTMRRLHAGQWPDRLVGDESADGQGRRSTVTTTGK